MNTCTEHLGSDGGKPKSSERHLSWCLWVYRYSHLDCARIEHRASGEKPENNCQRFGTVFLASGIGEHDICAYRHGNFKSHTVEVSVIPFLDRPIGGEARVCSIRVMKNGRYTSHVSLQVFLPLCLSTMFP
jgi:hypothetical protein